MEALLDVRNVSKSFGKNSGPLFENIHLQAFPGESISIVGKSGQGKSSLLQILGLLDMPTKGTVFVNGKKAAFYNRTQLRRAYMGFVFQSFHLIETMSVEENIFLPFHIAPFLGRNSLEYRKRRDELLERLGLLDRKKYPVHLLSGGEKQRVALARALLLKPPIILADEPTGNLDAESALYVFNELFSWVREGNTLIFVTHDLSWAERADKIYTLKEKQLYNAMGEIRAR